MSSNESSDTGTSAEAAATSNVIIDIAPFGSSRGSGLARGKARRGSSPSATTTGNYKPTAIGVINTPREHQNLSAPTSVKAATESADAFALAASVSTIVNAPASTSAPAFEISPSEVPSPAVDPLDKTGLNIIPPERPKRTRRGKREHESFVPTARKPQRGEDRKPFAFEGEAMTKYGIPRKFLYVRTGVEFVPIFGKSDNVLYSRGASAAESSAPTKVQVRTHQSAQKSESFIGWLKSFFGRSSTKPEARKPADRSQRPPVS